MGGGRLSQPVEGASYVPHNVTDIDFLAGELNSPRGGALRAATPVRQPRAAASVALRQPLGRAAKMEIPHDIHRRPSRH